MSSLFNITQEHLNLLNQLEDSIMENDIPDDGVVEQLNINEGEAKDKIRSYYYFIKQKEAEITMANDEVDRLKLAIQKRENLIKRLRDTVNTALEVFGEKGKTGNYKINCGDLSVWNVYTKPVVLNEEFEDPNYGEYKIEGKVNEEIKDRLEAEYDNENIKFNYAPDKRAIKEVLLGNVQIEGASIDYQASYVRFK